MDSFKIDNMVIMPEKQGGLEYSKVSYPLRYGRFSEIKTQKYIFQFNLNGEIKFITGRTESWPDQSEWLKRTVANDWIYYSTGGYSGVYDAFGEYYLPCLSYPSNMVNSVDPFNSEAIITAIDSWTKLYKKIDYLLFTESMPVAIKNFFQLVRKSSPGSLTRKSNNLHEIIGDRITVLPPDTRHVDYEVIPVVIADGCLYKCGFCKVKNARDFSCRNLEDISGQIKRLKKYYGQDIRNYNSIFLGQHDGLHAGIEQIEFAAIRAYKEFELEKSNIKGTNLFLFGSVDSILNSDNLVFDRLNKLPFLTYINIGLESADRQTLSVLKKSITPEMVEETFKKIFEINRQYEKIEITSNFVFGEGLPESHIPAVLRLIEMNVKRFYPKGTIYFSPLFDGKQDQKKGILRDFYKLKMKIPLPTYLYLIQRL